MNKSRGELFVARPHRDNPAAGRFDLLLMAAQLRGCLSAKDSAEVPQEIQDNRLLGPEVSEPVRTTFVVLEDHLGQRGDVH